MIFSNMDSTVAGATVGFCVDAAIPKVGEEVKDIADGSRLQIGISVRNSTGSGR